MGNKIQITKQKVIERTKTFSTLQEILEDEQFKKFAAEEIEKIRLKRSKPPRPGFRWKRGAYEQMREKCHFNADFMIANYPDIVTKKSNLSVATRSLIDSIMLEAVKKTYRFYTKN